jgi:hypothetical protein
MGKFGKYFREVSVVVIGVAITLFASYWLTKRNENKDIALYLHALKLELEENLKVIDETNKHIIQRSVNYSDYLRSHDKKLLNVDTLKYYMQHTVYNASSITIKTNAFEMFKTSGNMRLVGNKELLLSIWDAYAQLVELKGVFDLGSQMKMEEMKKYFFLTNNPPDEVILKNPPMYEFYVNMFVPYTLQLNCNRVIAMLRETISKF